MAEPVSIIADSSSLAVALFQTWHSWRDRHGALEELIKAHDKTCLQKLNTERCSHAEAQANKMCRDPRVPTDKKQDIRRCHQEVRSELSRIEGLLAHYNNNSTRKQAWLKNYSVRKEFKLALEGYKTKLQTFEHYVDWYKNYDPSTFLLLDDNCFSFLAASDPRRRTWIAETTFVEACFTRGEMRGVPPGTNTFLFERREYKATMARSSIMDEFAVIDRMLAGCCMPDCSNGIPLVVGVRDVPVTHAEGQGELLLVMYVPRLDLTKSTVASLQQVLASSQAGIPTGGSPLGLSNYLPSRQETQNRCADLAQCLLALHKQCVVHKSVRPENIILVWDKSTPSPMSGRLYLIGWRLARDTTNPLTDLAGEQQWDRRIYHHPQRHGLQATHMYVPKHDIYSLGVCLLEILRWRPLVSVMSSSFEPDGAQCRIDEGARQAFFSLLEGATGAPRRVEFNSEGDWMTSHPRNMFQVLEKMLQTTVRAKFGDGIPYGIWHCLTGSMDRDKMHEGGTMPEETEQQIVQYIVAGFPSL